MNSPGILQRLNFSMSPRLPVVRQSERSECGLACLAMVAGYHGNPQTLTELRVRSPSSVRGSSLAELMRVATDLGLQCRALRLDMDSLPALATPCILHWDLDHYVVLRKCTRNRLLIHDPASGARRITLKEASEHFTGVALEVQPLQDFKPPPPAPRLSLSSLWHRIVGLRRHLALLLALSLILQLFSLVSPFYVQVVVDDVVVRSDTGLLGVLALGFGLLLVVQIGTELLRSLIVLHMATRLHLQMIANLFHHLIRLPLDYFYRRHLGDTLSRFSSTESIREVITSNLVSAVVDGLMGIITLVAMFVYDTWLTLLVMGVLCVHILLRLAVYRPMRELTEQGIVADAACETSLLETLRAMQAVKLLQGETQRQTRWEQRMVDSTNLGLRLTRIELVVGTFESLLFGVENLLVVYLAANSIIDNKMTVGMFFAFMAYKGHFSGAVQGLVENLLALRMIDVHLERLADIVLTDKEDIPAMPALREGPAKACRLEVRDLEYSFAGEAKPLLKDMNFVIEPGELAVITGPSGVGKSTLMKCLLGLLECEGTMLVDGKPIKPINYRARVAAVMQDDQLMEGTVAENISGFDERPDEQKMLACADMASIHDDILQMPLQYLTQVGDGGAGLSGGQVQRILLARALYREPDILFLDEATCHLDLDTETDIIAALASLPMTRVVIAHRPETIEVADQVIPLMPGEVN